LAARQTLRPLNPSLRWPLIPLKALIPLVSLRTLESLRTLGALIALRPR
jgi:hypothetical protein